MKVDSDIYDSSNNTHFIAMVGHNLVISCYYSDKRHYAIADYHKLNRDMDSQFDQGRMQRAEAAGGYWAIAITFHNDMGRPKYSYGDC